MVLCSAPTHAADAAQVPHPFLLWTRDDLAAIRKRIETQAWAAEVHAGMKESKERDRDLRALFQYAVMGDESAGESQKKKVLGWIRSQHPFGSAIECRLLAYDLLHDQFTAEEHALIEKQLRKYIEYASKPGGTYDKAFFNNERNYARYDAKDGKYTRTNWLPNIIFPWKLSANLAAAVLRDEKLIRDTWGKKGSIRWYFDEYLGDLGFYMEELGKMGATPGALLMYCTAVRNLGLDELGFGYRGRGGATMRGHIESVIHFTFAGVDTGTDRWRFDRMSAGDVRPWLPFQNATINGWFAKGSGGDGRWAAPGAWGGTRRGRHAQWDGYSNFTPKMQTPLWFEWGHRLWPDAGFDWFLARMRSPDEMVYTPTLYFGVEPIDEAKTKPPDIRSAVYPDRGFVMLRAKEGPEHWLSPAPSAALRLTVPYAHSVRDPLVLCGYYAFNRPIYQNPKSDPGYAFKFSRSIRSHCGVMIDGHIKKDDWGRTGCLEPSFTDDCTTRQDFSDTVKFVAARTRKRYRGVDETRALMLTSEYLFDLSAAHSTTNHSYTWLVHTFGKPEPDKPRGWKPSNALTNLVPELSDVRTLATDGRAWSLTVRQVPPDDQPTTSRFGEAWWSRKIGVRIHMLGQPGALAHIGATPKPYNHPRKKQPVADVDGVTVVSSLQAPSAVFAAVHEPFVGKPQIDDISLIATTDDAMAVRVEGKRKSLVDDRLLVRVGQNADEPVELADDDEMFRFTGHAFVRVGRDCVTVHGGLEAMRLRIRSRKARLVINGKEHPARVSWRTMTWDPGTQ